MKVSTVSLMAAAMLLSAGVGASPAAAQTVRDSSCAETVGTNTMTYDCGFNVKDYVTGAPVTFVINYACSGPCGPVLSFGLRDGGFSPSGVSGHMIAGRRTANGLELTFVFDTLKKTGAGAVGNAHFTMNLNVDDGQGTVQPMPCPVDVHLGEKSK